MKASVAWVVSLLCIVALTAPTVGVASGASARQATRSHASSHVAARCPKRAVPHGSVTFTTTLPAFPTTVNPDQSTVASTAYLTALLESPLFRIDAQGRLHPVMLARLPTVANGDIRNHGRSVILRFKHGLRWSNGAEITSHDFKFSWKIDSDPASGPLCTGSCDIISGIATPDRYTAAVHLQRAAPRFLTENLPEDFWPTRWPGAWNNNAHRAALMLFQATSFSFDNPSYPTDGPYQVAQIVPGQSITLHSMQYYDVESCGAHVQTVTFASNDGNPAHIAQAIAAKKLDFALLDLQDLAAVRQAAPAVRTQVLVTSYFEHLELDHAATFQGAPNPLVKTAVRLALALAIEKTGLVERTYGVDPATARALVASTIVPNTPRFHAALADPQVRGQWDPLAHAYVEPGSSRALADARNLLARAGYPNGFRLEFATTNSTTRDTEANAVAEDWARIGVRTRLDEMPATQLFSTNFGGGDFQVGLWAYITSPADPLAWRENLISTCANPAQPLHHGTPPPCDFNESLTRDPIIDRAFATLAKSYSPTEERRAFNRVQVEINHQAHWIPLYFRANVLADDGRIRHLTGDLNTAYAWTVP